MTLPQLAFTLRDDAQESTEFEYAQAYALVCQDLDEEYLVMYGSEAALRDLYCWGLLNFGFASPLPDLVDAVDRILRPEIGTRQHTVVLRRPAPLPTEAREGALAVPWTMDVSISHDDGQKIVLAGMTDLILMFTDHHGEKKIATGGSGMQKSKLVEMGIADLFGEVIHERFARTYYGERNSIASAIRAKMLDKSRRQVSDGPGFSVGTVSLPLDDEE